MDRPELCPNPAPGHLQGIGEGYGIVTYVPCKRWSCRRCGPINAWKLQRRMQERRYTTLITLTHRWKKGDNGQQALRAMRHDFHKLTRRIARYRNGTHFRYVSVVEWTENGAPHLHVLAQCPYISHRWLSRVWRQLHDAPIVDIRRVKDNAGAARYLTKYLTKATVMPKRMRKWSASRGFLPPLPPPESPKWPGDVTWTYHKEPLTYAVDTAKRLSSTFCQESEGEYVVTWRGLPRIPASLGDGIAVT